MPSRPTHSRGKERLVFIETFLGPREAITVIYGNDVIFITFKHANKRPNAQSKIIEYSANKQTSCSLLRQLAVHYRCPRRCQMAPASYLSTEPGLSVAMPAIFNS